MKTNFLRNKIMQAMIFAAIFLSTNLNLSAAYQHYQTLQEHTLRVSSVALSRDERTLASGSYDCTIKIWQLNNGQWACVQTLDQTVNGHTDDIQSLAFSPDGRTMASVSSDATIKIWHLDSNGQWVLSQTLDQATDNHFKSVSFSPDGSTIASGSSDNIIKIWRLDNNGQWIMSQTLDQDAQGHTDWITSVAFSPDGRTMASVSWDKTIKIWEFNDSEWALSQTLNHLSRGHTSFVASVAFSPDGAIVSGSWDHTIKVWLPAQISSVKGAQTNIRPDVEETEVNAVHTELTDKVEENLFSSTNLGKRTSNTRPQAKKSHRKKKKLNNEDFESLFTPCTLL